MVMETTEASLRAQKMGFPNPRKVTVLALIPLSLGTFLGLLASRYWRRVVLPMRLLASSSLRSDLLTITLDSIGVATKGFIHNCFYSLIPQDCLTDPGYYLVNVAAHPNHQWHLIFYPYVAKGTDLGNNTYFSDEKIFSCLNPMLFPRFVPFAT